MSRRLLVDSIQCRYRSQPVVNQLSFSIEPGEIACLLGPSGCGKTTVLHAIGGFIPVYSGQVILDGRTLSSPGHLLAPEQRRIGMVFQDYALFPHLSVKDNIAFGLGRHSETERHQIVSRMLDLVRLPDLGARYPHELSGGQQQRVALARGLAPRPLLLLMDEPFSNLDSELGRQLCTEVRDILKHEGITALVVTHATDEASLIGDTIGILADQQVQQWDTPVNLYQSPRNRRVAKILGRGQPIPGRVTDSHLVETDLGLIHSGAAWKAGDQLELFLSPDEIVLTPDRLGVQGDVIRKVFLGALTEYTLKLPSGRLVKAACANGEEYQLCEKLGIQVKTDNLVAFRIGGADQKAATVPLEVQEPSRIESSR